MSDGFDEANEEGGFFGKFNPRNIKDFFMKRKDSSLPSVVPSQPKDEFAEFLAKAIDLNRQHALTEYSGFWTQKRLMDCSIVIYGYFRGGLFVPADCRISTHKVYGRSCTTEKFGSPKHSNKGLSTLIYQVLLDKNPAVLQHFVLTCETTKRQLAMERVISLIPEDTWTSFAFTKDCYTLYPIKRNKE